MFFFILSKCQASIPNFLEFFIVWIFVWFEHFKCFKILEEYGRIISLGAKLLKESNKNVDLQIIQEFSVTVDLTFT